MEPVILRGSNGVGSKRINLNINDYRFNACNYKDSYYHNCLVTCLEITNSDFKHVHFFKCPISGITVEKSCMTWGLFLDSDISFGSFKNANMFLSTFRDSSLEKVSASNSNFGLSSFSSLVIENCTFSDCDFRGSSFDNVMFSNVTFVKCRLDNVSFEECLFQKTRAEGGTCSPTLVLVREDDKNLVQTLDSRGVSNRVTKFFYGKEDFAVAKAKALSTAGKQFGKEDPTLAKELLRLFDNGSGVSPGLLVTAKKIAGFVAESSSKNVEPEPKKEIGYVDSKTEEMYLDEYGDYYSRVCGGYKETPKRAYLFCSEGIPGGFLEETR